MVSNILLVLAIVLIGTAIARDICDENQAECRRDDVVCRYSRMLGPKCRRKIRHGWTFTMIDLTDPDNEIRQAILNMHNKQRSKLARGQIRGYSRAANMRPLTWDKTLADMAMLNVRQCDMKHDHCKTETYRNSGQNLAYFNVYSSSGVRPLNANRVAQMVKEWVTKETRYAGRSVMRKLREKSGPQFMHFTQVVMAKNKRVGCALAKLDKRRKRRRGKVLKREVWLACNYGIGNTIGKPVYKTGKPGSKCPNHSFSRKTGLCKSGSGGLLGLGILGL